MLTSSLAYGESALYYNPLSQIFSGKDNISIENQVSEKVTISFSYSETQTKVPKIDNTETHSVEQSISVSGYRKKAFEGGYLGYSINFVTSDILGENNAVYDVSSLGMSIDGGYILRLRSICITPICKVNYDLTDNLWGNKYRERWGDGEKVDIVDFYIQLGLKLGYRF